MIPFARKRTGSGKRRGTLFLMVFMAGLLTGTLIPGEGNAGQVNLIFFDGVINPVAAEYITSAIDQAEADQAEALVIQLDTPGGLDSSMRIIIKAINASLVPIIVYVAPPGGRAASAGVFITLAAHIAAMAPGTNIGAAHPVALGGGQMDEEMKAKIENDAAAYIRSIAERRGRNADWAEKAVRESVSVPENEALELGIIDLVAENVSDLLAQVDGWEVETSAGPKVLNTTGVQVKEIPMSFRLRALLALSDPNVAYILMLLGIYGIIFELSNPGAIFPGVVGAISLILAFYALQTLPINLAGLLLLLLGLGLFVAEVMMPSHGLLTLGGIVSMVLGSLMLMRTDAPFMRISWSVIFSAVVVSVLFFSFVVGMGLRAQRPKPLTGIEGLIGAQAIAQTDLAPEGRVLVHGELWDAISDEEIKKGESAEVKEVRGLKLIVKKSASKAG